MIRKRGFGMLAVVALLAFSATAVEAGAGGSPSPLTSFFVCNSINGEDANRQVNVQSSFWNFNPMNVRIGNATLACAFAKLLDPQTGAELEPNLDLTKQQLKCYSISVSRQSRTGAPPTTYDSTDVLGGQDTVSGSSIQFICGPATLSPQ
jgi:hypothetical protein